MRVGRRRLRVRRFGTEVLRLRRWPQVDGFLVSNLPNSGVSQAVYPLPHSSWIREVVPVSNSGLVEISEVLGDPRLREILDDVYRSSSLATVGLALPWAFRSRVNRLLDPIVAEHGIRGGGRLHPGVCFLDVNGEEVLAWAATSPFVVACTDAFRARLQERGIPFLTSVEGHVQDSGQSAAQIRRRSGTTSARKGLASMLVTSS